MTSEHDERSKLIAEQSLDRLGDVTREKQIAAADSLRMDIWLERHRSADPLPTYLFLLALIFTTAAVVTPIPVPPAAPPALRVLLDPAPKAPAPVAPVAPVPAPAPSGPSPKHLVKLEFQLVTPADRPVTIKCNGVTRTCKGVGSTCPVMVRADGKCACTASASAYDPGTYSCSGQRQRFKIQLLPEGL